MKNALEGDPANYNFMDRRPILITGPLSALKNLSNLHKLFRSSQSPFLDFGCTGNASSQIFTSLVCQKSKQEKLVHAIVVTEILLTVAA
jgi:hypothetical protein